VRARAGCGQGAACQLYVVLDVAGSQQRWAGRPVR